MAGINTRSLSAFGRNQRFDTRLHEGPQSMEDGHANGARTAPGALIELICTPPANDMPEPTNLFRRLIAPLALVEPIDPACLAIARDADYSVMRHLIDEALLNLAQRLEVHHREFNVVNQIDPTQARRYVGDLANNLRVLRGVLSPEHSAIDLRCRP